MKELNLTELENVNGGREASVEAIHRFNKQFYPRGRNFSTNPRIDRHSAHKYGGSRVGGAYIID
ncbi:hypothetical protein EW093_02250 [Thiospirochaeta perfilievii]|uniref:Bacteriocin n=1 Tax=Thiospirochaeta perfilievii TaxID=252967 RepID=A0A5C1Q834_9SPIO|nr:hypothetical protein [Thiospirochaeta perfilievii]QEN03567.1 hypothetical protein EW093_02250 [Thiospirochaeta perfilievii]